MSLVWRAVALAAVVFGSSACVRVSKGEVAVAVPVPVRASSALESRTVDYVVPERAGRLSYPAMDSVGQRVRALRVAPTALTVAVGDTVRMAEVLRVEALDSAGVVLGELPGYDFGFSGRGMRLLADGRFVFSRTGTTRFTAQFPEQFWRGKPADRPAASVSITIQ
ncbi:MAG: hypothetical protein O9271_17740 [Gemmatimonas sp.]|nr:hypothetical protein [Gemmatimonas sp.]